MTLSKKSIASPVIGVIQLVLSFLFVFSALLLSISTIVSCGAVVLFFVGKC